MILSKLKSSNLIFDDISIQDGGTGVFIFHGPHNRGALACDEIKIDKVDKSISVVKNAKVIAVLSGDVSFIFIDRKLVNVVSTEANIERMVNDGKEMEEFAKKYPDLAQMPEDGAKLSTGHYL
jgi:hypothetical protein